MWYWRATRWFHRMKHAGKLPAPYCDTAHAIPETPRFTVEKRRKRPKAKPVIDEKAAWTAVLAVWYRNMPDSVTHSAASCVLKRWGVPLPQIGPPQPADRREWHTNTLGMTMLKIRPGRFVRRDNRDGHIDPDAKDPVTGQSLSGSALGLTFGIRFCHSNAIASSSAMCSGLRSVM